MFVAVVDKAGKAVVAVVDVVVGDGGILVVVDIISFALAAAVAAGDGVAVGSSSADYDGAVVVDSDYYCCYCLPFS